jgi:hypothetical protein
MAPVQVRKNPGFCAPVRLDVDQLSLRLPPPPLPPSETVLAHA